MPGLRVQDLEIPWAAAVCQAVLPEPPEGLGCRSATEVADTVQAGEAEAAEVDEQVLHGEDTQFPARPDDALRQAEGVERGVEQAGGYHVVHRALVGGQLAGQTLGDDERMVVGNFSRIHAAAVERSPFQGGGMSGESRVPLQQGDAVGYLVEHIVREVAGAGTGVAQHLLLVKRLGDGEGLVRREAVPAVRLFLQGG